MGVRFGTLGILDASRGSTLVHLYHDVRNISNLVESTLGPTYRACSIYGVEGCVWGCKVTRMILGRYFSWGSTVEELLVRNTLECMRKV